MQMNVIVYDFTACLSIHYWCFKIIKDQIWGGILQIGKHHLFLIILITFSNLFMVLLFTL